MTREDAKNEIYNIQGIGTVYFVMEVIDRIYDDFEEDLITAYASIDKVIDSLEEMKEMEFNKESI